MGKSKNRRQTYNSGNSHGSSNKDAWSSENQNHSRFRSNSASDPMWRNSEEHFPALGAVAAPAPKVNVWEQRKSKLEEVKALEPQNEYDEEAMLQQALALSMLQAAEEERLREEDEYLRQVGILEDLHDDLEYFDTSEEFISTSTPELETPAKIQSTKDFPKENSSKNIMPNSNQNVKTYNSTGAKPKLNKIIERFGGWGLKDKSVTNSEKLSDFVDEVVNVKPLKKVDKYDKVTTAKYQNNWNSNKENGKCLWHVPNKKEDKKPAAVSNPENVEVLYDGKGTFIDDDDFCDIQKDNTGKSQKYESPNKVLDTWLNSEDDDGLNGGKEAAVRTDVSN